MYLQHFGLSELPFTLTPNTQFFLGLPSHHEALQVLLTALDSGEGFIKVTGEVGTGKTLLCRKLLAELPDKYIAAYLPDPYLKPDELRLAVAQELGIEGLESELSQQQVTQLIQQKVMALTAEGQSVLIILDEAQALTEDSIEAVRLFTNLETESRKLVQIVLFGQPELDTRLAKPELRQVKQRISFSYQLRCLYQEEVQAYIQHRMAIAGYTGAPAFDQKSCDYIYRVSKGVPRIINILAHKCLMLCFGENQHLVAKQHVQKAALDTESVADNLPKDYAWAMVAAASLIGVAIAVGTWKVMA
ncbi:AAA family ATPase [Catenovulum sp. SM1970]|uniref:ExeA family protein n=1 Tax=Marinifaba aquimaris TaxID=2741323 RepID=UPI001573EDBD|nr:AAA family ATPase [Marinifaba aquimaris]NTS75860.1 AAA family ATPase [Marinifaba aquimaris]